MGLKDLLLTPFYLAIIFFFAIILRNRFYTNSPIRKYYLPALTVKVIGAIVAGLIYQFYYGGGDTFTFFQGVEIIWEALKDDPLTAFKIILYPASEWNPETAKYTQQIWTFRDPGTFLVVKLASLVGFFSFGSYLVIAILFAFISFLCVWHLYKTFVTIFPALHKELAISLLFIPSVFFWGSGLFKDTITFAGLSLLIASCYKLFILKNKIGFNIIAMLLSSYIIIVIKSYIFLCFFPPFLFLIFLHYKSTIKSDFLRRMLTPILILISGVGSYFILLQLGSQSEKYAVDKFLDSASSMQRWHTYLAQNKTVSSGYSLSENDGTISGMISTFPSAVNVTLFRPYLWEGRNPVMLMAGLESTFIIYLTFITIFKSGLKRSFIIIGNQPIVFFCITFSIIFAFAVGYSTYNFGALVRYKIPCIPFFVMALFIIRHLKKESVLLK